MGQAIVTYRFYMHGKKHFTQTGWKAHAAAYGQGQDLQSMNLRGRVHVVTGANSGIGREVCEYLVGRGSRVYMVCRNAERGMKARDEIAEKIGGGADVHLMVADCGLAGDMRRVATELREKEAEGIDCLVCNAGAMVPKRTLTSEGHEVTFATHFLHGTYLLSEELRPLLGKKTGRVIAVSSGGMLNVKYDHGYATGAKGSYDKQLAYAYAKRGQVLLCEYLANQPGEQITFVSCHPGWTDTPGVEFAYGSMKKWLQPMRSLWEGAEGICWLCVAPTEQIQAGSFYLDRQPQKTILASWTKNTKKEVEDMVVALRAATS